MRDLAALHSWHADWRGLRVLVLGLGVTGFAAADTLCELGAEVLVAGAEGSEQHLAMLEAIGARWCQTPEGAGIPDAIDAFGAELVIVSPGFAPTHPLVRWAEDSGIEIWGDLELAWRVRDKVHPAEWLCVTGTNGKTTTTQLTAAMLAAGGIRTAPVGNIGVSVLDAVRDPSGFEVLVVELSSHQLHWFHRNPAAKVEPLASVCLNLADDHLLWHGSAGAYRDAKARVFTGVRLACVYNVDDPATRRMVEHADVVEGCRAIGFSLDVPGPSELGFVDGILVDRAFLEERATTALELATLDDLRAGGLSSRHLAQDAAAAAALARSVGVAPAAIRDAIRGFRLGAHRIQLVASVEGIAWVDDSKATNAHAADASLAGFERVVWVLGGLLKGIEIAPLVRRHAERLAGAVVIGVDRAEVLDAFARHAPAVPLIEVDEPDTEGVMPAVVRAASSLAVAGDTVLLAPSAASMDQFVDYADRGHRFAEAVRGHFGLGDGNSDGDQF